LADGRVQTVESASLRLTDDARLLYRELGVNQPSVPTAIPASLSGQVAYTDDARRLAADVIQASSRQLAWITILDIGLFFAILMVGFAYVWKRGDLDWVRAVGRDRAGPATPASGAGEFVEEPVYSA